MNFHMKTHGGAAAKTSTIEALSPVGGDIAVDEAADFGYLLPPGGDPSHHGEDISDADLDTLGTLMVPNSQAIDATPDAPLAPVLTYWGQFLDHELTARTDRESLSLIHI